MAHQQNTLRQSTAVLNSHHTHKIKIYFGKGIKLDKNSQETKDLRWSQKEFQKESKSHQDTQVL